MQGWARDSYGNKQTKIYTLHRQYYNNLRLHGSEQLCLMAWEGAGRARPLIAMESRMALPFITLISFTS